MTNRIFPILAATLLVAGCNTTPNSMPSNRPFDQPAVGLMDESVPPVARQACLDEVRRTTNNFDVAILEMIYSEANSQVKVGVGPDRAPWRCLVSRDGVVADVMSLTDEGRL